MSAAEVKSYFKEDNSGPCGCGCGDDGILRVKKWRDGTRCTRNCKCPRCRGARNKRKGARGQSAAARALGAPRSTLHPGHEELTPGLAVRWEHKSGHQSSPVITRFRLSRAQSEAQRSRGDTRPFVATFSHDGLQVACIDLNDLPSVVWALVEQWSEAG